MPKKLKLRLENGRTPLSLHNLSDQQILNYINKVWKDRKIGLINPLCISKVFDIAFKRELI